MLNLEHLSRGYRRHRTTPISSNGAAGSRGGSSKNSGNANNSDKQTLADGDSSSGNNAADKSSSGVSNANDSRCIEIEATARDTGATDHTCGPRLTAEGLSLTTLASGGWTQFEKVATFGDNADGTYLLPLTPTDDTSQTFTELPAHDTIRRPTWLGFISNATNETVFYIDQILGESLP